MKQVLNMLKAELIQPLPICGWIIGMECLIAGFVIGQAFPNSPQPGSPAFIGNPNNGVPGLPSSRPGLPFNGTPGFPSKAPHEMPRN